MTGRMDAILTLVILIIGGIYWGVEYAAPKNKVLSAATSCLTEQGLSLDGTQASKTAWKGCMKEAEGAYGTDLLRVVGY